LSFQVVLLSFNGKETQQSVIDKVSIMFILLIKYSLTYS